MSGPTLADDLALAHELADAADEITLARFGAVDLVVEAKPDLTPVSDADLAVEDVMRRTLSRAQFEHRDPARRHQPGCVACH